MKIKVEPFLMKKGNRVAKAAIEFDDDNILKGFHMVGFTICDDVEKGLFVLFPASIQKRNDAPSVSNADPQNRTKPFFFLRPSNDKQIDQLQDAILDVYETMISGGINHPRMKQDTKV